MAASSGELETAFKKYIDNGQGREKLRRLLQTASADTRYNLIKNLRGVRCTTWTGLHRGVLANDLDSIMHMLVGLTPDQRYDVVKIQSRDGRTALHFASAWSRSSLITSLLSNLSEKQKYNLLKLQNKDGGTALHKAVSQTRVEIVQAILTSVSSQLLIQLLSIRNKKGQTVTDIKPELQDELAMLISEGKALVLCRDSVSVCD